MKVVNISNVAGETFPAKDDKTILDTVLSSDAVFEYSCKTGQCGVCKTALLKGEVIEVRPQLALTDEDKRTNKILTCCCSPVTDILIDAEELRALKGIETKTLPVRIDALSNLANNIVEVTLRLPPTASFSFVEGQYLDVIQRDVRRSYSIASTAREKRIRLLIKRYPGGKMSDYWFDRAKVNDLLRIEGPKGTFFLRETNVPLIFLATGTGIAPVISILESLDADKSFRQTQPIHVYWGNRSNEEFVYQPFFSRLNVSFNRVNSQPDQHWNEKSGYVQDSALNDIEQIQECTVYACGSNAMIHEARKKFVANGLPENQFYSDAFVQSY